MKRTIHPIAVSMAFIAITALAGIFVVYLFRPDPIVFAFSQLTVGMSQPEVERIFGWPPDAVLEIPDGPPMLVWSGRGGSVAPITFDENSNLAVKIVTTGTGAHF